MASYCGDNGIFIGGILYLVLQIAYSDELLEADSEDPLLIVDRQQNAEGTRLPNSHSAALAMAFIFLCVLAYGAYRVCKCKCVKKKQPLTVSLDGQQDGEVGMEGLENYIKDREAYLAIYGPKSIKSVSGAVNRTEQKARTVITVTDYS